MINVTSGITSGVLDLMFLHLETGFANTVFKIKLIMDCTVLLIL